MKKSLYDDILSFEKTSFGVMVIFCVAWGWRKIAVSSYVMFRVEFPVFIKFIVGIPRVNTNPGFIDRVSSGFVVLIIMFSSIVFDWRIPFCLYKMFSTWIEKFPSRVV